MAYFITLTSLSKSFTPRFEWTAGKNGKIISTFKLKWDHCECGRGSYASQCAPLFKIQSERGILQTTHLSVNIYIRSSQCWWIHFLLRMREKQIHLCHAEIQHLWVYEKFCILSILQVYWHSRLIYWAFTKWRRLVRAGCFALRSIPAGSHRPARRIINSERLQDSLSSGELNRYFYWVW